MNNFGMKFAQFMMGRRGRDEYGVFLLVIAILLSIIYAFSHIGAFYFLSLIILVYQISRFMSRNISKRYQENQSFLKKWNSIAHPSKRRKTKKSQAESATYSTGGSSSNTVVYRYFNCPDCGQKMRAPNGKGRIRVKCPRCEKQFETLV